ncbi:protein kinase [bacterium]|nr:protein kinase [bacterium]
MSLPLDATGIGQLAIKLGIATDAQVRELLIELDDPNTPADALIRLMERKGILTPWQGGKLRKGDLDGYFLGGYRLLYKIASGSFGRVYRGDDPRTGQVVAVKVLRNKWTMDKQKVDLFVREGKLGMTLRHQNVVAMLAVGQDAKTGQYYLVMEFVEGGNLRDLISIRKKIGIDEALKIMEECASGLAGAYAKGLTHRDIKPTNILIASQGISKLVDFGLAEISSQTGSVSLQRQSEKDEDVAVDRTVDYAGLEKATGMKPGDVRSDIYFLGTVLYEMVTGEPLMPVTKDKQARMAARRYQEVEDMLAKGGAAHGLPAELQRLIAKMVSFDPTRRVQTPAELVATIQETRVKLGGAAVLQVRSRKAEGPHTLFVVEENAKLQDAFREKFRAQGYRVLMSIDPGQPLRRFQQQPYHALIVDAGTVGEDGVEAYSRVLKEADTVGVDVGAVLILNEDQAHLQHRATKHKNGVVLVRPVTMKQLIETVYGLAPPPAAQPPAN